MDPAVLEFLNSLGLGPQQKQSFGQRVGGVLTSTPFLAGAGGSLLNAVGALLGGDGGQGKRLKEFQGAARQLLNSKINEGELAKQQSLYASSITPEANRIFQSVAQRVGLGSGIGGGVAANQITQMLAEFAARQRLAADQNVNQDRRLGAQLLGQAV